MLGNVTARLGPGSTFAGIPDRVGRRSWRDGRRVPGDRPVARPPGRAEADRARARRRPALPRAVPRRAAARRVAGPRERDPDLRGGRARRAALPRDALRAGQRPAERCCSARARSSRSARWRSSARSRARSTRRTAQGLVHRDVKPANVLLDEDEHAYLTDFGVTKQLGDDTSDAGHGHARLPGAGADPRRAGRRAHRRLRARLRALRVPRRHAAVPAPDAGRDDVGAPARGAAAAREPPGARSGAAPRPRAGARRALPDLRGADRRGARRRWRRRPRSRSRMLRRRRARRSSPVAVAAALLALVARRGGRRRAGARPGNGVAAIGPDVGADRGVRRDRRPRRATSPSARAPSGSSTATTAPSRASTRRRKAITGQDRSPGAPTDLAAGAGARVARDRRRRRRQLDGHRLPHRSRDERRSPTRSSCPTTARAGIAPSSTAASADRGRRRRGVGDRRRRGRAHRSRHRRARRDGRRRRQPARRRARGRVVHQPYDAGAVTPIDPRTNRARRPIHVGDASLSGIAVGGGSVWVTAEREGVAVPDHARGEPGRDADRRRVRAPTTSPTAPAPSGWPTTSTACSSRIDPAHERRVAKTPIGAVQSLAAGAGSAWVSTAGATRAGTLPASACDDESRRAAGRRPDRLGSPAAGLRTAPPRAMADAIRTVLAEHGFRAGQVHRRLPLVRRLDGAGGHLRAAPLRRERQRLRERRSPRGRDRPVELGLRPGRAPDPQPRARRPAGRDQPHELRGRPHARRRAAAGRLPRNARDLLPDRHAPLRPPDVAGEPAGRGLRGARPSSSASSASTCSTTATRY